jgi:hypothetical protein
MLATSSERSLTMISLSGAVARRSAFLCIKTLVGASVCALSLTLSGCNLGAFSASSTASSTLPPISGHVHGGQQPVSGANIQLYAANTAVSQGASTALISSTVRSDANGNFSIASDFICPAPGALVYIVATGGNPGLSGTVNNTAIALMAALGTCSTLNSSTFVSINELTTVASVQSLAPFMLDYAHVGANASNVAGLTTAFNSAVAYVDPSTGQFAAPPASGVVPPTALINTLADILAACINTSGGSSGDGTPCGNLLRYTSTATDTIAAFLSIAHAPSTNVTPIFGLIPAASPFRPVLATAPASFAMGISLALSAPYSDALDQLLVDSQSHLWLLRPALGTLSQYDSNLNLLHSYTGSYTPGGTGKWMALDPSDNLWVSIGTALLKISSNGTVLSPATGYPLLQNGLFTYQDTARAFVSDSAGNIWFIGNRNSDGAVCLLEYSNSFVLLSPSSGYCGSQVFNPMSTSVQQSTTQLIADATGDIYLFFYSTLAVPVEKFYPSGFYVDYPTNGYFGGVHGYQTAVFDPVHQKIWGNGSVYLDYLNLDGTVAFTSYVAGQSAGPEEAYFLPADNSIAVDGSGNYWEATAYGSLLEETSSGVLNASGACTVCGIPVIPPFGNYVLAGLAINSAGDIFTLQSNPAILLKLPGLASAK